jgi:uncharacterized protein
MSTTLLLHSLRTMCFALTLSAALNPAYAQRDMADPSAPVNKSVAEWQAQADAGDALALRAIGQHYNKGTGGVRVDYKKAMEYTEKSAEKGNAASQTNMGDAHSEGKYARKDDALASAWYAKAAAQNDVVAIYNLSIRYYQGTGVVKDLRKATELAAQAAELKHAPSMMNLSAFYAQGLGVEKDIKKAHEWVMQALALDYLPAITQAGYNFKNGNGVSKDAKKSCELFVKGGDGGDVNAMFQAGACYFNGAPSWDQNKNTAKMWFRRAADKGHQDAKAVLQDHY